FDRRQGHGHRRQLAAIHRARGMAALHSSEQKGHLQYPANAMPSFTTNLRVSQISPLIFQSEIRSMSVECDRVGGINLAQGICDTDLPESVAAEAIAAIRSGRNIY